MIRTLVKAFLIIPYFGGIISCFPLFSQNLITNPSFEDNSLLSPDNSKNWHKYYGYDTPDYFNLGTRHPYNNIFDVYMGGALPKDGDAFMGIFCYRVYPSKHINNIREFIEAPLKVNLIRDSVYIFKISLLLDEESNVAIKNFGVLFTAKSEEIGRESKLFLTAPSISFDSVMLDNTKNWTTLSARFKASGNENYIVLGNFYPDNKTIIEHRKVIKEAGKKEKWKLAKNELAAYYYIDALSLEEVKPKIPLPTPLTPEENTDEFDISKIKRDSAVVLENVNFKFNTTDFTEDSYQDLDKLLRFMQNNDTVRIKINGYTDNIGSRDYNLHLSYDRSVAVKNYLMNKGISGDRIECAGYGFDNPIRNNNTEENRQINRRVEFIILTKSLSE